MPNESNEYLKATYSLSWYFFQNFEEVSLIETGRRRREVERHSFVPQMTHFGFEMPGYLMTEVQIT